MYLFFLFIKVKIYICEIGIININILMYLFTTERYVFILRLIKIKFVINVYFFVSAYLIFLYSAMESKSNEFDSLELISFRGSVF